MTDTALIVGFISFLGVVVTVIVSVILARMNIKGAQSQAIDEISTGASTMLKEYRAERTKDKATIEALESKVKDLEAWRDNVNNFILDILAGAHRLRNQVISMKGVPVYNPPPLPEWLINHPDDQPHPEDPGNHTAKV